jgi:hypothetical protein
MEVILSALQTLAALAAIGSFTIRAIEFFWRHKDSEGD